MAHTVDDEAFEWLRSTVRAQANGKSKRAIRRFAARRDDLPQGGRLRPGSRKWCYYNDVPYEDDD